MMLPSCFHVLGPGAAQFSKAFRAGTACFPELFESSNRAVCCSVPQSCYSVKMEAW